MNGVPENVGLRYSTHLLINRPPPHNDAVHAFTKANTTSYVLVPVRVLLIPVRVCSKNVRASKRERPFLFARMESAHHRLCAGAKENWQSVEMPVPLQHVPSPAAEE